MALLKDFQGWTPKQIEAAMNAPAESLIRPKWFSLMSEPIYQEVHYFADRNETVYAERETYYFLKPSSPSDSTWMVPGVEVKRRF